jgi:peptide/nickel transport system permease protein
VRALLRLLLSRLLQGVALLVALSFLLFGVLSYLPGDPVDLLVASNPALSPADVNRLKKLRGLDQPFPVRWWRWLYGHHEAKDPPPAKELPAVVGVLPAPRPFAVDVAVPPHDGLTLEPLPPLTLDGDRLAALVVDAGAWRFFVVVTDANGQQAVWSLPVYVAPPAPAVLHGVDPAGDERIDEGAEVGAEAELDERSGTDLRREAVARRALDEVPATIDVDGVVGQRVAVIAGRVVVEAGAPVVDEDRFVGGLLFGELGWSWATKRPVRELLFGQDVVCGDGLVGPGESCDDRNVDDGDGCDHACFVETPAPTTFHRLDTWLAGAVTGLGRVGNTLVLTGPSLLLSMAAALLLGSLAARKKDGALDVVIRGFAAVCSSVPAFFVALVLIMLFAEQLQWFPSGGMQSPGIHRQGAIAAVVDRLAHLVLPLSVLVIFWSGRFVRQVRSAVLSAQGGDFVRTARARGLSPSTTFRRHVRPNAALPLVTLVGLSLPSMFGGALLTETVFAWPGLGRLQYDAILQNDSYVAVVVFLGTAAMVFVGSLAADVVVLALEPGLRR